jgi:hypothetical protein
MPKDDSVTSPLRKIQRLITSHDTTGRAIFSQQLPEVLNSWRGRQNPDQPLGSFLGYAISAFPIRLINDSDVVEYVQALAQTDEQPSPPGIRLRCIDFPPKFVSSWRRAKSLDLCFVVEGDLDCILDSGETKALKRGDVTVQRGTMHVWRNSSSNRWARLTFVSIDATPIMVNGEWVADDAWTGATVGSSSA